MKVSGAIGIFSAEVMNGASASVLSAVLQMPTRRPVAYDITVTSPAGNCDVRVEYRDGGSSIAAQLPDWNQFSDISPSTTSYSSGVMKRISVISGSTILPIKGPYIQYRLIANAGNTANAHTVTVREIFEDEAE